MPAIEKIVEQGHLNTILTYGAIHAEAAMGRLTVTPNASPDIRSYAQTSCRKQDNSRSAADRVSRIKRFVAEGILRGTLCEWPVAVPRNR